MIGVRGRRQFAALALVLACAPWFRGGRDAGGLLVMALFLALGFLATRRLEPKRLAVSRLGWWYAGLLAWAGASALWSVNRYQTLLWVITWGLGGLAALLAAHVASDEASRAWLVRGLLELAALFSLYGVWLFVTGDYNRLTSTFYWANPWATFLFPAAIVAWGRYLDKGRRLYLGLTVLLVSSFLLTYSRAALAVLLLAAALLAVVRYHRRVHAVRLGVSLVLVALSCFVLIQLRTRYSHQAGLAISSRFVEAVKGDSVSGLDRLYYLKSAWAIVRDHPVLGTGAGTYGAVHAQYQFRVISAGSTAHNIYAQTVAELGLGALVILVALLAELALGLRRRLRHDPESLLLVVGLVALLLHLGLDIGANYPAIIIFTGTLIGALYRPRQAEQGRWVSLNWLALTGLLLVAQPLYASYQSQLLVQQAADAQDRGQLPLAADTYREAHLLLTYNPDTLTAEGINRFALASLGRSVVLNRELAISRAEEAIYQDSHNAENYLLLGRAQWLARHNRLAEAAYRDGLRLDPWNLPLLYIDLATLYLSEDRYTEALELASEGLSKYPPSVIAKRNSLDQLPSQIADLYVVQGRAWEELGNQDEAIHSAEQALATDRANLTAGNMYKRLTGRTILKP